MSKNIWQGRDFIFFQHKQTALDMAHQATDRTSTASLIDERNSLTHAGALF